MNGAHPADPHYLLTEQYPDSRNLSARAAFHARFSASTQRWFPWVFDQFMIPIVAHVLELGSGPGWLWKENAARISPGWTITLSDFSPGMLDEARANLASLPHDFAYERIDAQAIPYPNATFDTVIANQMLYHVPDRRRALAEMRRVLKPDGRLYVATNGRDHMRDLDDLLHRFAPELAHTTWFTFSEGFTLQNAPAELEAHFSEVRLRRYEDALIVTEIEPLIAYIRSSATRDAVPDTRLDEFRRFLSAEMAQTGAILITKDVGLFEATP